MSKRTHPNGTCHDCGASLPLNRAFCDYNCRQRYHRKKQKKQQKERGLYSALPRMSQAELERRMDAIAARANDGTHTWESLTRPGVTMRCHRVG